MGGIFWQSSFCGEEFKVELKLHPTLQVVAGRYGGV